MHNNSSNTSSGVRPYLIGHSGQEWHFDSVAASSAWLQGRLKREFGDTPLRVSLVIRDRFALAQWIVCALLSGITVNPINPDLPIEQIETVFAAAQPDLVVTDVQGISSNGRIVWNPSILKEEAELRAPLQVTGLLLIFTSGTTGWPKGILLPAHQILANVHIAIDAFGFNATWTTASLLPLFHTFTIITDLLSMLLTHGQCAVLPVFSAANLTMIAEGIRDAGVNSYSGVPVVFQLLARFVDKVSMSAMKFAIGGAAPLPELVREHYYHALGHPILPCYGMSESTCFISISKPGNIRAGSVGKPAAEIDLVILNSDEPGTTDPLGRGEIAIRGNSVIAHGYFKQSDEERAQHYQEDYFLTGDVGRLDEDGYLYITGRKKNMLIKGGEKYYLEDIDRVLLQKCNLNDCASVVLMGSNTDDDYVTFVVAQSLADAPDVTQLRRLIVGLFGSRAAPQRIEYVNEIPRSPTGKVHIAELLKMAVT